MGMTCASCVNKIEKYITGKRGEKFECGCVVSSGLASFPGLPRGGGGGGGGGGGEAWSFRRMREQCVPGLPQGILVWTLGA